MQLVAYGAQDIYLTGNPQITFFKVVYRRHTNFSMEAIEQTWNGGSEAPGRCTATISRNGDLVHKMYLQLKTAAAGSAQTCANPSAVGITDIEIEIGGQKIDKHTGQWMETWTELNEVNPAATTADDVLATTKGTLFQKMSGMGGVASGGGQTPNKYFFVPLLFWFCRNPGLALPLIALQYHEVKVILNHNFTIPYAADLAENKLFCDYIYLDTDERRRFAQVSHEYLIEQVQEQSWSTSATDLNFNHPVKELIWVGDWEPPAADKGVLNALTHTFQLKLNGHDRFSARNFEYFTRTQVWQHHTGFGGITPDTIAVYSFALKPEEHQPSGTCNFSRIDNAQLIGAGGGAFGTTVYAVNYNVLRIMSGMGGLAYSN